MGQFESGLRQGDLSLPNDEGQHLFVAQVSVWLRAKLKQLPYHHPQGPGGEKRCRHGERHIFTDLAEFFGYVMLLQQHPVLDIALT